MKDPVKETDQKYFDCETWLKYLEYKKDLEKEMRKIGLDRYMNLHRALIGGNDKIHKIDIKLIQ